MSIRPEFAARLSKFFTTYGHHYTPTSPPQAQMPMPAPQAAQAVAPKPDMQRPDPEPKVDRSVSQYINDARSRLGLPPIGPQSQQAFEQTQAKPQPMPIPQAPANFSLPNAPPSMPQMMPKPSQPMAAPVSSPPMPKEEPPHHSEYQPRDSGKFAGPPIAKWYKMQETPE